MYAFYFQRFCSVKEFGRDISWRMIPILQNIYIISKILGQKCVNGDLNKFGAGKMTFTWTFGRFSKALGKMMVDDDPSITDFAYFDSTPFAAGKFVQKND